MAIVSPGEEEKRVLTLSVFYKTDKEGLNLPGTDCKKLEHGCLKRVSLYCKDEKGKLTSLRCPSTTRKETLTCLGH